VKKAKCALVLELRAGAVSLAMKEFRKVMRYT
jgi:hypothetical protein